MNLKLTVITLFATIVGGSVSAQDILYRTDGGREEVKVKEVGTRTIVYKKWTNKDGPDFVIPKGEVERIEFENGDEEFFNKRMDRGATRGRNKRVSNVKYGKNILSLAPISMTNTSATGVGISYERVIDKNYIISFYLPVTYSFRSDNNYNYSTNAVGDKNANVVWISPGVKFYPAGSNHKVSYAVGVGVPIVTGTEPQYVTVYNNNGVAMNVYESRSIFMTGLMVTNYLNIQPTPRLYLGLQLGLGIPYFAETTSNNNNNYGDRYYEKNSLIPLVDFSFRIGFRF